MDRGRLGSRLIDSTPIMSSETATVTSRSAKHATIPRSGDFPELRQQVMVRILVPQASIWLSRERTETDIHSTFGIYRTTKCCSPWGILPYATWTLVRTKSSFTSAGSHDPFVS